MPIYILTKSEDICFSGLIFNSKMFGSYEEIELLEKEPL